MGGTTRSRDSYRLDVFSSFCILNFVLFWVYANQFVPSPFLPQYLKERGLSEAVIGFFFCLFPLASFLASFVCSGVVRKFGPELSIVLSLVLMSISTALFALDEPPVWTYFLFRSLQGISTALFTDCVYVIVGVLYPEDLAYRIGLVEACISLGCSLGRVVGGYLYAFGGFDIPFILVAALLMVSAFSVFYGFVDTASALEALGCLPCVPSPLKDSLLYVPLEENPTGTATGAATAATANANRQNLLSPEKLRSASELSKSNTPHHTGQVVEFESKAAAQERFRLQSSPSHRRPSTLAVASPMHSSMAAPHMASQRSAEVTGMFKNAMDALALDDPNAPPQSFQSPNTFTEHADEQIEEHLPYSAIMNLRTVAIGLTVAVSATTYTFFDPVLAVHLQHYFGPISETSIGGIMGLQSLVYMVAAGITGSIASKGPQNYFKLSVFGLFLCGISFLLVGPAPLLVDLGFVPHSTKAWIAQFAGQSILALGNAMSFVPALPWLQYEVRHTGPAGQEHTCAMVVGFMSLGEAIAPLVSGYLTEKRGYQASVALFSMVFFSQTLYLIVCWALQPQSEADIKEANGDFIPLEQVTVSHKLEMTQQQQQDFPPHLSPLQQHLNAAVGEEPAVPEQRKSWMAQISDLAAASGPKTAEVLQAVAHDPERVLVAASVSHSQVHKDE